MDNLPFKVIGDTIAISKKFPFNVYYYDYLGKLHETYLEYAGIELPKNDNDIFKKIFDFRNIVVDNFFINLEEALIDGESFSVDESIITLKNGIALNLENGEIKGEMIALDDDFSIPNIPSLDESSKRKLGAITKALFRRIDNGFLEENELQNVEKYRVSEDD